VLSWLASSYPSIESIINIASKMSDEKAPLIPRFEATQARAEPVPRQRCSPKKVALRVLGATAAAALILYYSIPEGNGDTPLKFSAMLILLQSHGTIC
jgi:hypothetical protein